MVSFAYLTFLLIFKTSFYKFDKKNNKKMNL